jgi:hypothetical protein
VSIHIPFDDLAIFDDQSRSRSFFPGDTKSRLVYRH